MMMKKGVYKGAGYKGSDQSCTTSGSMPTPPRSPNKPTMGRAMTKYNKHAVTHQSENPMMKHPRWL